MKGALLCLQDNVALIAVLEALDPGHPDTRTGGRRQLICVANTHIHANPELNDVKLWQVGFCQTDRGLDGLKGEGRHDKESQCLQLRSVQCPSWGWQVAPASTSGQQSGTCRCCCCILCAMASYSRWGSYLPSLDLWSIEMRQVGKSLCPSEPDMLHTIFQHVWGQLLQDCCASFCSVSHMLGRRAVEDRESSAGNRPCCRSHVMTAELFEHAGPAAGLRATGVSFLGA